ncbi:MAG: glycosyltransferase family 87 protein [Candidatus Melainabacteria bacterium]|nr:glycosyltransferase family 87 protein [Candidatus Melainabacteria bacterium]
MSTALQKKAWFAYFSFLLLWILATYGDTINAFIFDKIFAYERDGSVYTCDFILYYNNGKLAWRAFQDHINIYDPVLQNEGLQQLVKMKLDKIFYSQYPPYLFLLMMPLPFLPIKTVWVLWEIFGLLGVICSIILLVKKLELGEFKKACLVVASLSSFPYWLCFRLAQVALLLYPAFLGYFICLQNKKWFQAGLLGGFCLLKLQYAPVMFLLGLILGGWQFFAGFSLMGIIYLLGSILVLGWKNVGGYPEALKFGEIGGQVTGVSPETQQNIRGQLVCLLNNDGPQIHAVVSVLWLLASLALAYVWFKNRRSILQGNNRTFMYLGSITLLSLLISSPHTHKQDYVFVILPAAWILFGLMPEAQMASKKVMALKFLIIAFPFLSWFFFLLTAFMPAIIQPFFAWAVAMLVLLLCSRKELAVYSSANSSSSSSTSSISSES